MHTTSIVRFVYSKCLPEARTSWGWGDRGGGGGGRRRAAGRVWPRLPTDCDCRRRRQQPPRFARPALIVRHCHCYALPNNDLNPFNYSFNRANNYNLISYLRFTINVLKISEFYRELGGPLRTTLHSQE